MNNLLIKIFTFIERKKDIEAASEVMILLHKNSGKSFQFKLLSSDTVWFYTNTSKDFILFAGVSHKLKVFSLAH